MEAHSGEDTRELTASGQLASSGAAEEPGRAESSSTAAVQSGHDELLAEVVLDLGDLNAAAVTDDEAIEVTDEELTEVTNLRKPARSATRSIPPPPPSMRPPLRTSAPPPRKARVSSLAPSPSSFPGQSLRISSPPGAALADLRLQLAQSRAREQELAARLSKAEGALSSAEQRLRTALGRIAQLEAEERKRLGTSTVLSGNEVVQRQVVQQKAVEAEEKLKPSSGEAPSKARELSQDGELRLIEGIGPRFEAALRKHGVTRISQLAAWSDADVKRMAKRMKIPRSRIVKGRWVERARKLADVSSE